MIRRPPRATRTDTLFPYTTLFRARTGARAGRPRATLGRSCAPPLLPPVRLHVAERTPLVATHAQVELLDVLVLPQLGGRSVRPEEHTSELQSLMRISYAVFCLKNKTTHSNTTPPFI